MPGGFLRKDRIMIDHNTQEYVANHKLDLACKRQEKKNLKEKGRSTSWVSMLHYIRDYMLEYMSDRKTWVMKKGWRQEIKNIG